MAKLYSSNFPCKLSSPIVNLQRRLLFKKKIEFVLNSIKGCFHLLVVNFQLKLDWICKSKEVYVTEPSNIYVLLVWPMRLNTIINLNVDLGFMEKKGRALKIVDSSLDESFHGEALRCIIIVGVRFRFTTNVCTTRSSIKQKPRNCLMKQWCSRYFWKKICLETTW